METVLEVDGKDAREQPTVDDLAQAVDGPRGEDWFITLHRGDDDYMDVGEYPEGFVIHGEEGDKAFESRSHIGPEAVKAMLVAFAEGRPEWRDMAAWGEPTVATKTVPPAARPLVFASLALSVLCIGAWIYSGHGGWLLVMVGLGIPIGLAFAVLAKQAEVKRAAAWTKGSARIVSSTMADATRHGKKVREAQVEYEFTAGFHRFRGRRVSLGELMSPAQQEGLVARYRVGTNVAVYYDPKDPRNAVLERDPPPYFSAIWGFIAFIAGVVSFAAYWYLIR